MGLQDKTEAASPRKREDARKEGRVAKSADATSAIVLIVALFIIKGSTSYILDSIMAMTRQSISSAAKFELTSGKLHEMFLEYGAKFGMICLPILAGTMVVGLACNVAQVGFKVSTKSITPNFSKMDPIKGITKMFSGQAAVELIKSLLKVAIIAYLVYSFVRDQYPMFIDLAGMPVSQIWQSVLDFCWGLVIRSCMAMLIIGLLDYGYQKYSFEQSIKMTKQEVKDEHKRNEGNPEIKGAIRRRQIESIRRRMIQGVAKADVVITNPTRIAVAIKYDPDNMFAPIVIAKGQRLMAERIKAIARENGVPIIENKPVARLLYKVVEVGQSIPEELYQTVAEILAYVYSLSNKAGKRKSN